MKIIDQSYEICKSHGYDLEGIYKDIERAARVSYKSEDKITKDSAYKMVSRLIEMKHYSPLEFGTVYLIIDDHRIADKYIHNKYSKVTVKDNIAYITTNYRVIIENGWKDDLNFLSDKTEHHAMHMTVRFITNRAVSHELVRHRSMSFMQESQRYVAYDKDKFGNEITFIKPVWYQNNTFDTYEEALVNQALSHIEMVYMTLRERGLKPQQARQILPNATKTELYMCGFESDWEHFFELRDKPTVDPQMYSLIHPFHEDYIATLNSYKDYDEETIRAAREGQNA